MHQPISITTTMRNPERIKNYLEILFKYDNEILDDNTIDKIIFDLYDSGNWKPEKKTVLQIEKIMNDNNWEFSKAYRFFEESKANPRKYSGWKKGVNSRFFTYFEIFLLLGYVELEEGKRIKFYFNVMKALNDPLHFQLTYLNFFMKYQTNNPYKSSKLENKVNLLPLVLDIIEKIDFIKKEEIAIICVARENNAKIISDKIINYRKLCKEIDNSSKKDNEKKLEKDNVLYHTCLDFLGIENIYSISKNDTIEWENKRHKRKTIIKERPDDIFRKLYFTGIFFLDNEGKIKIEEELRTLSTYIINNYYSNIDFTSNNYFDYMGKYDENLSKLYKLAEKSSPRLEYWYQMYEDDINAGIEYLSNRENKNKPEAFKNISDPLLLEFLTSLLVWEKYGDDFTIIPNYKILSSGFPRFTAPAGVPDIEILEKKLHIEVTLMKARNQLTNEVPSIYRHASDKSMNKAIFVAPKFHEDTKLFVEFLKEKKNFEMVMCNIEDTLNINF